MRTGLFYKTRWALLLLMAVVLSLMLSSVARAVEFDGRVSLEDYINSDSSSSHNRNILTTRLSLSAGKINEADNFSFHFNGRLRNTLSNEDFNSTISETRISTAYGAYQSRSRDLYVALGRFWPKELGLGERVDGINVVYNFKKIGLGLFGGAQGDPYDEGFGTDYTAVGLYAFVRRARVRANLAFTNKGFKGATDRRYFYGQLSYSPVRKLRFYSTATVDFNLDDNTLELTNSVTEVTYRPKPSTSLTFGLNRFRSIRLYESMDPATIRSRQLSVYVRGSYKINKKYSTYAKIESRRLDYPSSTLEARNSTLVLAGARAINFLNTSTLLDGSILYANNYNSDYTTFTLRLNRNVMDNRVRLSGRLAYTRTNYELTDITDNSFAYGASANITLTKQLNASISYDGTRAEDYTVSSVMTRLAYRF